jgi:hypothetical protein
VISTGADAAGVADRNAAGTLVADDTGASVLGSDAAADAVASGRLAISFGEDADSAIFAIEGMRGARKAPTVESLFGRTREDGDPFSARPRRPGAVRAESDESAAALALPDEAVSPVVSAIAMPGVTARAAPTPNVTTPALSHGCPAVCLRVNLLLDEFFLAVPATFYPSFGVSDG